MRVYIAGPMSGHPHYNRHAFKQATHQIRQNGHTPLNPYNQAAINAGYTWAECMITSLALLSHADAITTLENSDKSPGAQIELSFAKAAGIPHIPLDQLTKQNHNPAGETTPAHTAKHPTPLL